ncbi:serine-rich protein, partial [Candidatus Kaiserbacteria bacterium]|nr:serine-rich protein [Candidatus Kaiserbacteria bacterium]
VSHSESTSVGQAVTHSQAVSNSEAYSVSGSRTASHSETVSEGETVSLGRNYSNGVSLSRGIGAAAMHGLGAGVAPSASISKSFQWKDEAAVALTQLLEQQLNILKEASEEGGFYSDVYMLTRTANGQRIAEAGAVQAFGGSQGVVTHLQARRPEREAEVEHLLKHARTFTPSTVTESLGWINGYAYSTVVTPTQQAAYSAPGLFEEGTALTVQERTPPFAFVPDMKGEAVLGLLYSTERGELTRAPLRVSEDRHFHTLFAADTGFGKTVAAERLAVEAVNQWHHRAVVLDFGAGWRRLVNGPLPNERVDLYQLFPGATRPFRWNFMQIGKRLDPDRQYMATAELIANAGRMGPRQLGYLKRTLWELYSESGVLTTDPSVYNDLEWGRVRTDEVAVLEAAWADRQRQGKGRLGMHTLDLEAFERQALAVHRSKRVNITALYARLKQHYYALPKGDQVGRTSLEGILIRLEPFTHGELAVMYGGSQNTLAIEDLGLLGPEPRAADRWGLCVLEGGAEMDDYSKAVILSLAAWHLYNDSIVRRRETVGGFSRPLDIFFEEANKILSGAVNTIGNEGGTSSRAAAVELWQQMWRDGRKYSIYLHPIVQTLSELPAGIQSSCNNAFFGQMKNLADRDLAVGHLARSERGFTDEEYKRYLSRIPRGLAIVKFGYSEDVVDVEPMLARPLRVTGVEPGDAEILARFGPL